MHYERDTHAEFVDMYSQMYTSPARVTEIGEDTTSYRGLPFILCEYGHAMGNGPGGLSDYRELFEKYPRCQGGFIWEFIDHGLRTTVDGRRSTRTAVTSARTIHDGNFVCDGLLFPDRTPSPGMLEYIKVIEPLRIVADGNGEVSDHQPLRGARHEPSDVPHRRRRSRASASASGTLTVPPIAPGETVTVDLPVDRASSPRPG